VESGALENDRRSAPDKPAHFSATLGALLERVGLNALKLLESLAAPIALVFIGWHLVVLLIGNLWKVFDVESPDAALLVQEARRRGP
jgi:hypothetical protein